MILTTIKFSSIFFFAGMISFAQENAGAITGKISDPAGNAIAYANIVVQETTLGAVSDTNGSFRIDNLQPGKFNLSIMCMGYHNKVLKNIVVQAEQTVNLNIILTEKVLQMEEIIVTPGQFSIAQDQSTKQQVIEKERIAAMPATLDDIYRVIQIMPGVTFSDDYSAHFHVRGGRQNENLILLDGIEIYDPYHLKDIGGAVGVMNMDIIDNMSIMTGGFEAKYGDRLSSVVSIQNRKGSADRFRGNVVAGGTGFSMLAEGPIPFGSCIVSFRKSFLKEAAEILNPTEYTFSPSFYDVQSKVSIAANKNNQLTLNVLYSKDHSYLERWRQDSELYADYGNSYQGLVWKSTLSAKILSEFIVSRGHNFWDNRMGNAREEKLNLTENVCSWNLDAQLHARHQLEGGVRLKQIHYSYETRADDLSPDQHDIEDMVQSYFGSQKISPRTYKVAFYLQDKCQLFEPLHLNIGVRYDYFDYNEDQQVSPRLGASYHIQEKTVIRAAWGHYYQSPIYTELVNVRGHEYNPQAQKSTHYIFGIEQFLTENTSLRIEGYQKSLERMIGHYLEIDEGSEQFDLKYGNPFSGECRGVEFFLNGRVSPNLTIWATYAYSRAKMEAFFVDWENIRIEKQKAPRFTDQPHNASLFLNYELPKSWAINVKWRYLSGIPYTPRYPQTVSGETYWIYGDYNSARYPAYHRLDVRVGKKYTFSRHQLEAFLEIKNAYNRKNVFMYDYQIDNGEYVRKAYYTLPFLPTIEFKFSF
jgi:outer membrane receptor protein involved in Fe transport